MYKVSKKTSKIKLSLCLPTWLVAQMVEITLNSTWGAGGFAISPQLNANRVIERQTSPICTLLENIRSSVEAYYREAFHLTSWPASLIQNNIEAKLNELPKICWEAYSKEEASPFDVDVDGRNTLHVWPFSIFEAF